MSQETILVKRHNHCVHPCNDVQKEELLKILLEKNANATILIVTSDAITSVKALANENITVLTDSELNKESQLKCDILISYNLPDTAIIYMVRLAHALTYAYILLDENEHKKLYPIETLLGRTLKQEMVQGFNSDSIQITKSKAQRDDDTARKHAKHSSKSSNRSQSKSKYLGKDDNGKAMFSGKSGERNHRYDGTPKHNNEKVSTRRRTGKKINIKALKPKEDSE